MPAGIDDLIVAVPYDRQLPDSQGSVHLFSGDPAGLHRTDGRSLRP